MTTQVEKSRTRGRIEFAAIVMFAIAGLRIITAIAYFAHSQQVVNVANGLFGSSFWIWAVWDIVISIAAIGAGISLLSGREFGESSATCGASWSSSWGSPFSGTRPPTGRHAATASSGMIASCRSGGFPSSVSTIGG